MDYFKDCCEKSCESDNCYICYKGDRGEKGERGLQGIQGIKGDKGETGLQGERGLQGEVGEQGPQGIQGEQGPAGVVRPFEYAQFISIEPQTIEPNSLTSHVLFEERIYSSSGITMNNGIVTFNTPGLYRVTYELYPESGGGTDTIFTFGYPESTSAYLTGSDARVRVDTNETSATFLLNITTAGRSYRVNVFGTTVTLASGYRLTARLTITQVNHLT